MSNNSPVGTTFEIPQSQFSGVQQQGSPERYRPPQSENPIDAADNEDDDTNDWPDKITRPRRAPRIVPLRLIPISWQPLLDEAHSFLHQEAPTLTQPPQKMTLASRKTLLDTLNGARFDFATPEISDAMFPPLGVLEFFLALYMKHVQPRFPVLHLPTFNIFTAPPLLLIAMMVLGSSHSKTDRGRFARIFHGPLRMACTRLYELCPRYVRMNIFLLSMTGVN